MDFKKSGKRNEKVFKLTKKMERVNYLCVIDPKHDLPTFDISFHIFKVEKINTYGSILNLVVS